MQMDQILIVKLHLSAGLSGLRVRKKTGRRSHAHESREHVMNAQLRAEVRIFQKFVAH